MLSLSDSLGTAEDSLPLIKSVPASSCWDLQNLPTMYTNAGDGTIPCHSNKLTSMKREAICFASSQRAVDDKGSGIIGLWISRPGQGTLQTIGLPCTDGCVCQNDMAWQAQTSFAAFEVRNICMSSF